MTSIRKNYSSRTQTTAASSFEEQRKKNRSCTSGQYSLNTKECIFCSHKKPSTLFYPIMISRALYTKYSSSQNYYFTKDINEILAKMRTPAVLRFIDIVTLDEEEEFLKRFYQINEYPFKIKMLTEYYKYHRDIARMFMIPTTNVLNKYHDKKRRVEYVRITRMIREENEKAANGGHLDKPKGSEEVLGGKEYNNPYQPIENKILDTMALMDDESMQSQKHSLQKFLREEFETKKAGKPEKNSRKKETASKEASISNTLQDLNYKLGEIISNSRQIDPNNYFETEPNDSFCNLSNFLNYLNRAPPQIGQISNASPQRFDMFKKNKKQPTVESVKDKKEKIIQDNLKAYDNGQIQKNITEKINIYNLYQNTQIKSDGKSSKNSASTTKRSKVGQALVPASTSIPGFQSMTSREEFNFGESLKNMMNQKSQKNEAKKSNSNSKEKKGNISKNSNNKTPLRSTDRSAIANMINMQKSPKSIDTGKKSHDQTKKSTENLFLKKNVFTEDLHILPSDITDSLRNAQFNINLLTEGSDHKKRPNENLKEKIKNFNMKNKEARNSKIESWETPNSKIGHKKAFSSTFQQNKNIALTIAMKNVGLKRQNFMDGPQNLAYEENFENELIATPSDKKGCVKNKISVIKGGVCDTQRLEFQEDYHHPRSLVAPPCTNFNSANATDLSKLTKTARGLNDSSSVDVKKLLAKAGSMSTTCRGKSPIDLKAKKETLRRVNSSSRPKSSHPGNNQDLLGVESREKISGNNFSTDRNKKTHNRIMSNGCASGVTHNNSTLNGLLTQYQQPSHISAKSLQMLSGMNSLLLGVDSASKKLYKTHSREKLTDTSNNNERRQNMSKKPASEVSINIEKELRQSYNMTSSQKYDKYYPQNGVIPNENGHSKCHKYAKSESKFNKFGEILQKNMKNKADNKGRNEGSCNSRSDSENILISKIQQQQQQCQIRTAKSSNYQSIKMKENSSFEKGERVIVKNKKEEVYLKENKNNPNPGTSSTTSKRGDRTNPGMSSENRKYLSPQSTGNTSGSQLQHQKVTNPQYYSYNPASNIVNIFLNEREEQNLRQVPSSIKKNQGKAKGNTDRIHAEKDSGTDRGPQSIYEKVSALGGIGNASSNNNNNSIEQIFKETPSRSNKKLIENYRSNRRKGSLIKNKESFKARVYKINLYLPRSDSQESGPLKKSADL